LCRCPRAQCSVYPLGISFFGTAFGEPTLIRLASGYEAATQARAHNLPTFAATVPFDHIKGPLQQAAAGDDQMESGVPAVPSHVVGGPLLQPAQPGHECEGQEGIAQPVVPHSVPDIEMHSTR
jgi:hypothetical protein